MWQPSVLTLTLLTAAFTAALVPGTSSVRQQPADVFQSGSEGYACYRIPVLARLPNGDVALYAEGRHDNCNDLGGHTDIVFKVLIEARAGGRTHHGSCCTPGPSGKRRTMHILSTRNRSVQERGRGRECGRGDSERGRERERERERERKRAHASVSE